MSQEFPKQIWMEEYLRSRGKQPKEEPTAPEVGGSKEKMEEDLKNFMHNFTEEQKKSLEKNAGGGSIFSVYGGIIRSLATAGVSYYFFTSFIQPILTTDEPLIDPDNWSTSTYWYLAIGSILLVCLVYYGWYLAYLSLWKTEQEIYEQEDFYEELAKKSPEFKVEWERVKASKCFQRS